MDFFLDKINSVSAKMKGESPKFSGPSYLMNANSNSVFQQLSLVELYNGLVADAVMKEETPNQIVPLKQSFGYTTGNHFFSIRKSVLPPINNSIMDIFRHPYSSLESRFILNDHLLSPFCDQLFEMNTNSKNTPVKIDEKSLTEIDMTSACKKCDLPKYAVPSTVTLNKELANRKKKEINKRSKKRRRRQKKSRHLFDNCSKTDSLTSGVCVVSENALKGTPHLLSSFVSVSSYDDSKTGASPPNCSFLSSFIVPVDGSTDDDSDWDSCATEIFPEFEFTGLFVTSFCASQTPTEDDEMLKFKIHLQEVNKMWNKSSEGLEKKCKLPSKVTFAADEVLVEVFPVEMFDRKGEWEMYATERLRFKRRIDELEKILSPCLHPDHRSKVFQNITQAML